MILTSKVGRNADLFPDILSLYVPIGSKIADVTYGKGNFWTKVDISQYNLLPSDISTGTDCRALPYENESIDVAVFDPPYIHNASNTVHQNISGVYNNNVSPGLNTMKNILLFYTAGMQEAYRVLKPKGILIVKCQDCIESGKQVWSHLHTFNSASEIGFKAEDLFVMVQTGVPMQRWKHQLHARKNHSYFWVFKKG